MYGVPLIGKYDGVNKEMFMDALRDTEFRQESTRDDYDDGHTHIALPNTQEYGGIY